MITYVDTSTLIKVIIEESGSEAAAALWDQSEVLTSARILYAEARAALAAARRGGRLTDRQHGQAVGAVEDLWSQISIVEIDADLIQRAAELAEPHGLRGYDAVHLAAALLVGTDVVTSADRLLCQAARAEGFHVANPADPSEPTPVQTRGKTCGTT